jgi:hypothetical protein
MSAPVECPSCKAPLAEELFNHPGLVACAGCGGQTRADVFPAYSRPTATGRDGEFLILETESSCFYHPQKKAILACDGCGRFLCALCDCDFHGQHFCTACLQSGQKKGKIKRLEQQRVLYDSIALSLAVYALLIFYLTLVTAPIAIFIAIRHWNSPRSIVHRTKIRLVLAIAIAAAELVGWAVLIYFVSTSRFKHA